MLALIRFSRERGVPFLGTCGGFQHVLIEVARHVLGIPHADSAEHTATTLPGSVVVPVACPISLDPQYPKLYGGETVHYLPGSHLARIMDVSSTTENYFCNFEENPAFRPQFEAAGLRITAVNAAGVARALEWEGHPFFLATQFQPQMNSRPEAPHPLITAFVDLLMKSA